MDIAHERIGARDGSANEFEKKEALQFCRDLFLGLANEPFADVVDASQSLEAVAQAIQESIAADS